MMLGEQAQMQSPNFLPNMLMKTWKKEDIWTPSKLDTSVDGPEELTDIMSKSYGNGFRISRLQFWPKISIEGGWGFHHG